MCAQADAILYSVNNIDLAYRFKKICRDYDIYLINTTKFTDMVYLLSENMYSAIFIDCNTVNVTDNIMNFFTNFKYMSKLLIILIDYDNNVGIDNMYVVKSEDIENEIIELKTHAKDYLYERSKKLNDYEVQEKITSYLMSIGILPKHIGFNYIKQVILYGLLEGGLFCSFSKELYPFIASCNHTNAVNVERNIRNAISIATTNKKFDKIKNIVGDKPSNRLLLSYLVDKAVQFFKSKY